jgi:hypothetical protein
MNDTVLSELQARVTDLETKEKTTKSLDLAEKSFKAVLDADIHIDNKASRILTAIAFLTAATTAILNKAYEFPQPNAPRNAMRLGNLDVSLVAFSGFLLCILVGAAFYLAALGPSLNVPGWLGGSSDRVKSLLFFELIGTLDQKAWTEHWGWQQGTDKQWSRVNQGDHEDLSENLSSAMEQNYIYETWLLAQKARTKVRFMSVGSVLFKFGLVFQAPLVATLFTTDLKWGWLAFSLGIFFFLLVLAVEAWQRPPFESNVRAVVLAIAAFAELVLVTNLVGVWRFPC